MIFFNCLELAQSEQKEGRLKQRIYLEVKMVDGDFPIF